MIEKIGIGQVIASAESLLTATTPGIDAGMAAALGGIGLVITSGGMVIDEMAMTFATADIEAITIRAIGGSDIGKHTAVARL